MARAAALESLRRSVWLRQSVWLRRSVRRAVVGSLATYALCGFAWAQTPTPESKPTGTPTESSPSAAKTAEVAGSAKARSSDVAATANKPAEATTVPINVSLPTVHVLGSALPPETLKAARDAGYQIKVVDGATHFCKTVAPVGTRFSSENCINEQQLTLVLHRSEEQRERLKSILGAPSVTH